jgi:hypothetical protein
MNTHGSKRKYVQYWISFIRELIGYMDLASQKGVCLIGSTWHGKMFILWVERRSRNRLFLVASGAVEGVGDGLAGVGQTLLGRAENALALLLGWVAARAGAVADLLGGWLLALGLDGWGDLVTETGDVLAGLLAGRLLGVGSD